MSQGIVQNSLGLYCPLVELSCKFPYILPFYPHVPACHLVPQSSYSPMGWTGLSMGFSHVPSWGLSQCPVPSHSPVGWDWTVHGILTCPILKYTSKSSPVGWTGLSMGFSHVPSSNIPPNLVLWDRRDCPWDSHMSHPQIYLQIPVSQPIPQSCGMDRTVHGILTCPTLEYIPVSRPIPQSCGMDGTVHGILTCPILEYTSKSQCPVPALQSCGMDGTVHGILTCPILKYTSKSQCPIPTHSSMGLSTGFSHVPPFHVD